MLLRPSHLDCACLSLVASLSALPSSLLGADLYLHHPALLGPNHLSSFFSFLCFLVTAHFSDGALLSSFLPLPSAIVLRLSDLDRACLSLLVQVFPLLSSFDPCIRLSITLPMSLIFSFFSHLCCFRSAFYLCFLSCRGFIYD